LFKNNVDVNTNLTVATKVGHRDNYLAAMDKFDEVGVGKHGYIVINKSNDLASTPECFTNMFG